MQVGEKIKLEPRVVQEPAVGDPTAVVPAPPPHNPPPVTTAGAAIALPIVRVPRPLACTERLTEVRGRVVKSRRFGFVFGGRRAAVGGEDGAAVGGGRGGRGEWGARGCSVHCRRRDHIC